jgi:hypothetical protein
MSDDRFDQDLRAVLLEDAPGEVPDDLRQRVAAVPNAYPVAGRLSGPTWRRPVTLWIGAAAALVIVVAAASWWFGPAAQPGVGGEPSSSPSVQPPTFSSSVAVVSPSATLVPPTPTPPPSAGVTSCHAADIEGKILGWQGAAGSRIADVEITNTSASPCLIRGTPRLELLDSGGAVLIDSATAGPSGEPNVKPGDTEFRVAPGGHLRTEVQATNYCGAAPSPPIDIAFTLPSGGGRFVAVPGAGVSSDLAVPECMGSAPSQIGMNGWVK